MNSPLKKIFYIVVFAASAAILWHAVTPFVSNLHEDVLTKRINIEVLSNDPRPLSVTVGSSTPLLLEFAITPAERSLGLGGRSYLAEGTGLLFIFDKSDTYGIWMKNMLFPIDVAWLDSKYKIIHIEHDIQPFSYPETFYPSSPARYILETNAGFFDKNGISTGTTLGLLEEDDSL